MSVSQEMKSRLMKNQNAITFCMHTEKMHVFYLRECDYSRQLIVVEEDLLTNGIVSTFIVPKGRNVEATGYILQFSKKSGYLMLSYPPCRFVIWNANTQETLLFTETRGKNPYFINSLAFNDASSVLFFTAVGQRNIYCCCLLVDQAQNYSLSNFTKLVLPKKIRVYDLKSQPNDKKIVAACSDGLIRIWNSGSRSPLNGLLDPQQPAGGNELFPEAQGQFVHSKTFFTCLEFSSDGTKLLAGTNYGTVFVFDSRSLGNKHLTLASIVASPSAILSCKWLNYNGSATYKNQHFVIYTGEVALSLFKYSFQGILPDLAAGRIASPAPLKASAKIEKLTQIYQQNSEIKISDYYGVNMAFERYLQVHEFANVVIIHSLKVKQPFAQASKQSFDHSARVYMLWDRSEDKVDFPIVSGQVPTSLQDLLPNSKKQVLIQRQIFAAESMEVKLVATSLGTVRPVASLKAILSTTGEDAKFLSIQIRPLNLNYSSRAKFLLSYKQEDIFYTTSFSANLEKTPEESLREEQIENYLATQNRQALFLGALTYASPPVLYLLDSLDALTLDCHLDFIDTPLKELLERNGCQDCHGDELSRKYDLSKKVSRIFSSPFRNRFCIVYALADENKLVFSKNRIATNGILDFDILEKYVFTAAPADALVDVLWQIDCESSEIADKDPALLVGAVICRDKIYFVDGNLRLIRTVKIAVPSSCNAVHQARWFGPALFYITRTHVHYLCVDGTTNAVVSLDSVENKHCIAQIMMDRLVIASKPSLKRKQATSTLKFKTKVFSPLEALVCGELSLAELQKREPRENAIAQLIETYSTSNISPILIDRMQKAKLHHLAYYFIYNSENKQLPCTQKVRVLEQMLKTEGILELLFPNKNLSKDTDAVEVMKRLQNDPRAVGEMSSLKYLCRYYLLVGEFERALLVCHLLQDFHKMFIIAKATNIQPLMNVFGAGFLGTKLAANLNPLDKYIIKQSISEDERGNVENKPDMIEAFLTTDNFSYNIINSFEHNGKSIRGADSLREIEALDPEIADYLRKIVNRKDMVQSSMGFGENLYQQVYYEKPDEDDDEAVPALVITEPLHPDSVIAYIGTHSTFLETLKGQAIGGQAGAGGLSGNSGQQGLADEVVGGGDEEEEDQDENKDILILWRFDEGKGKDVGDLSNYEIEGELFSEGNPSASFDKIWSSLEGCSPLETEDIWGKKVPSQCSVQFLGDNTSLSGVRTCSEKWSNKQKKMKEFTMELWLKTKFGGGSLIRCMNSTETSLELRLNNFEIQVILKGVQLKFRQFSEEESGNGQPDGNNKPDENINNLPKLENNVWNHLALLVEEGGKVTVILNCKDQFASESELEGTVYEMMKNKAIILGSGQFKGEFTEFRLRKEKFPVGQLRDQYKTPLPIVSEKKKQIKFKVKQNNNSNSNNNQSDQTNNPSQSGNVKMPPAFNFSMPPLIDDNAGNAFDDSDQNSKVGGEQQFAFKMPPIVQDDIVDAKESKSTRNEQQFVFGMPTIIRDDEYEIKNNNDDAEENKEQQQQMMSAKSKTNIQEKDSSSNFDDFHAFGTFTAGGATSGVEQATQKNQPQNGNVFNPFQSFSGQPAQHSTRDFGDPFSSFAGQAKKDEGFGGFGSNAGNVDVDSAFGNFDSVPGKPSNEGRKMSNDFDVFNSNKPPAEGQGLSGDFFSAGFGEQPKGRQSFSNFGNTNNTKPNSNS